MAGERVTVRSFSAVGSLDFFQDNVAPSNAGLLIHARFSGNGSAKVLVNNFPDGALASSADFSDVTSWGAGAAQLTPTVPWFFLPGCFPYGVRIHVDSLQVANTAKFGLTF